MGRLMKTVPGRVIQKFLQDQAPNWAVLIAWNALFALFPIVVFAAAVVGFLVDRFGFASKAFYDYLLQAIPNQDAKSAAADALVHLQKQQGLLLLVGLIGLLWGGSALFGTMEQAFAVIYHTRPRDFVPQKLLSFAMVILFIITAGPIVASSAILPALKHIPQIPGFLYGGAAAFVLQFIIGVVTGFILFAVIYYVVPNRKQSLTKVLPGALLVSFLFELVTLLFPAYIALTNSVATYGKEFGLFFLLMTFFFFFGLITMIGIEVNSVIYPVPIELPGKDRHVVAAPESGPEDERRHGATNGQSPNGRRGIPARAALGMAVVASVVGVLLGRRRGNSG
jgi:membrane protein